MTKQVGEKKTRDIRELRSIDLKDVMDRLGFHPEAHYGSTYDYRLPDGRKISVTPEPRNAKAGALGMFQVWEGTLTDGKSGGAGAVNLVMAVANQSLKEAMEWLSNTFFPTTAGAVGKMIEVPQQPRRSATKPAKRLFLPERHNDALGAMKAYLTRKRGFSESEINRLVEKGLLYPNIHASKDHSFTNAVFVMMAADGTTPTGAMIRGCFDGKKPRKSTLPLVSGDPEAAFWIGAPLADATHVVLLESPIECISYMLLRRDSGAHCRSYGGTRWRLIEALLPRLAGKRLTCAFNNDAPGNKASEELAKMCSLNGIECHREAPVLKDWNNELCQNRALLRSRGTASRN